ncbi:hypothetical protein J8273_5122 [Carpediemonas membranifera]|uniref:Protein ZIP4 homolog n=1 Tax=Carpediemonas membranifera TaxID=201153 RepID=A0A8J6ARI6_9EUKA|nr:hypothetical protein J8273_5122 [Carpediemonas membranifera]|eukprot:KAG9392143.1 hypothetical protein J8273_5122 [Carpediemonas membranifera]
MSSITDKLQEIDQITSNSDAEYPAMLVEESIHILPSVNLQTFPSSQRKRLAYRIWNNSVIRGQNGKDASSELDLRILSARLLHSALQPSDPAEEWLNLTKFYGKIGHFVAQSGNHDAALQHLSVALETFETAAQHGAPERAATNALFSTLCWRAESLWRLDRMSEVKPVVARLRELLPIIPQETAFLGGLCYNLAVFLHNKTDFGQASFWFNESLSIYRLDQQAHSAHIARTLRFLAASLVAHGAADKAVEAARQSLAVEDAPSTRFVLLKALVAAGDVESAKTVMDQLIAPGAATNVAMAALQVVADAGLSDVSQHGLARATELFPGDPLVIAAQIRQLELLLSSEADPPPAATTLASTLVAMHDKTRLSLTIRPHVHAILWNTALAARGRGSTSVARTWAEWAERFAATDAASRARALLLVADCMAEDRALDAALTKAQEAAKVHFSIHAAYTVFRILLAMERPSAATAALSELQQSEGFEPGFLAVCAQDAYEKGLAATATAALEALAKLDPAAGAHVLPNLVKLAALAEPPDLDLLAKYLAMAVSQVRSGAIGAEDGEFFRRVAWNNALEAAKAGKRAAAATLLVASAELAALDPDGDTGDVLASRVRALLMAAGAAYGEGGPALEGEAAAKTMELLTAAYSRAVEVMPLRLSLSMVSTYHVSCFQHAMATDRERVEAVIAQAAAQVPDVAPCPSEVLALIANDCFTAGLFGQCVVACKALIARPPAETRFLLPRAVRMAIEAMEAMHVSRRELLPLYTEAASLIQSAGTHYIPIERYWVLVSCWNNAVDAHRMSEIELAEKLMAAAVGLLDTVDNEMCPEQRRRELKAAYDNVLQAVSDIAM